MRNLQFEMSDENRENNEKLAHYLMSLPRDYEHFNMSIFSSASKHLAEKKDFECGTAGCAIGHGPNAGIKPSRPMSWNNYYLEYFEPNNFSAHFFDWCFSPNWSFVDNTPRGAAIRIQYALEVGIPSDWFEQANGTIPYVFNN